MTLLIDLVDQVQELAAGDAVEFQALAARLRGLAEPAFGADAPIDALRAAVAALRAAAELDIGARALAGMGEGVSDDAKRLLTDVGRQQCIHAQARLALYGIPAALAGEDDRLTGAPGQAEPIPENTSSAAAADFGTLRNIAAYHREHARFHAQYWMQRGAELAREAAKIKLLGDHWLAGGGPKPDATVDYTDSRLQSAPCTDLNVFQAIHDIGILFLEGSAEPPEIGILKIQLGDIAKQTGDNGRFLAGKMAAAWERECMMLAPNLIIAAWPRLQVVVSNWRGALSMVIIGRLLDTVLARLGSIDFAPAAVRTDLQGAGARLRDAGWTLDIAAKISAETGSFMADNDWRYARYSAFLESR